MKNPINLLLLCISLFIVSCEQETDIVLNPKQINFQAPVIGQENYYLSYDGRCGELQPTGDTLILRIKDFNGSDIQFEEIFTEGSPRFVYDNDPYLYPAKWRDDMIEIKPEFRQNSSLFFFYGADFLQLKQNASVNLTQNSCILWNGQDDFEGDLIGAVAKFRVADNEYRNKKIVSCVPTILDIDAYLVYDINNLHSSVSFTKWEFWDNVNENVNAFALIDIEQ